MKKQFSKIRHEHNPGFDILLHDNDRGKLSKKVSKFMTRPAYAYTSLQQKSVFPQNPCDRCGYWKETEFWQKVCTFPWDSPEDYDEAVANYLPCALEVKNENDR